MHRKGAKDAKSGRKEAGRRQRKTLCNPFNPCNLWINTAFAVNLLSPC